MVVVRELDAESDVALYELWQQDLPQSTLYHSRAFHDFLRDATGGRVIRLGAERDGKSVGLLAWGERNDPRWGTVINSLPWFGSHGGCLVADDNDDQVRRALLGALRARIAAPDVLSATIALTPAEEAHFDLYAQILEPRTVDRRIGQVTRLPTGRDPALIASDLEVTISQRTRWVCRKANRQGFVEVVSNEIEQWQYLHRIHSANMDAIGGVAKPWDHFLALRRHLAPKATRLSVAYSDGQPVAAMLLAIHGTTVEYMIPAVDAAFRPLQPLSFLIWQAMVDLIPKGAAEWNWGGTWTTQGGLHLFKRGWGGEDRPYSYLVCASERSVNILRQEGDWRTAFPYFYVFPYDQL
ncbi:MAG: GNAT family N-acetyltransferase [Alphaproteobacteria bacterium]|nr:GNAT family N-acetyltransferase [Alphaproteobacteria bacterium]